MTTVEEYRSQYATVPGWLSELDFELINEILSIQSVQGTDGDLLEIGVFHGQSAILLGIHADAATTFTVCDIFDAEGSGDPLDPYPGLSRSAFEANYLSFHPHLPTVIEGSSLTLRDRIPANSCRFVHVDGSHSYPTVKEDITTAIGISNPAGVIAFDDFRSAHTPGVSAALWPALAIGQIIPICLSPVKLYAARAGNETVVTALRAWLEQQSRIQWETQPIFGREVIRTWLPPDGVAKTISALLRAKAGSLLQRR